VLVVEFTFALFCISMLTILRLPAAAAHLRNYPQKINIKAMSDLSI